jgi:hypothetical protein
LKRLVAGFFLAPIPSAMLVAFWSVFGGAAIRPVSVGIFFLLLFYALQVLIGLPLGILVRRRWGGGAVACMFAGAATVGLPVLLYAFWALSSGRMDPEQAFRAVYWFVGFGALNGLVFRLHARPDRSPGPHARSGPGKDDLGA